MKIAFVWDWQIVPEQTMTWKDGLAAALKVLSQRHEVKIWTTGGDYVFPHPYFPINVSNDIVTQVREFNPDKIILWGDTTRPHARALAPLGKPMALCFAGGHMDGDARNYIEHYFVESEVYKGRFEAQGCSVSTAFGTNTELFKPIPTQQKVLDAVTLCTFADWKRHKLFAEATKDLNVAAAGFMYNSHEQYCWQACEQSGALVLPHLSAEACVRLINASDSVVLCANASGGSQRTVLEAMACGIRPIVCGDSDKTSEYVRESGFGLIVAAEPNAIKEAIEFCKQNPDNGQKGIDYIKSKWTEQHYAKSMEDWLNK